MGIADIRDYRAWGELIKIWSDEPRSRPSNIKELVEFANDPASMEAKLRHIGYSLPPGVALANCGLTVSGGMTNDTNPANLILWDAPPSTGPQCVVTIFDKTDVQGGAVSADGDPYGLPSDYGNIYQCHPGNTNLSKSEKEEFRTFRIGEYSVKKCIDV